MRNATCNYVLVHCEIGSWGNTVHCRRAPPHNHGRMPPAAASRQQWSAAPTRGPSTSDLRQVPDAADAATQLNQAFIDQP